MIDLIVIALVVYFISKAVMYERSVFYEKPETVKEDPIDRLYREQKEAQETAMAEMARVAELEEERDRQWKEQLRLWREQERQTTDDEKVKKLARDIEAQKEMISDYYAQLDYLLLQQNGTATGGTEFTKWQNKIVTKQNQIRKAENKLADMESAKEIAERKMAA